MSWFIKYPEFISSSIVVTSQNPPEKLEARTNSKIEKILIKDHQKVEKGQVMMVLQSTGNYQDILKLRNLMDSVSTNHLQDFPLKMLSAFKLGEIQSDYNSFVKAFHDENLFTRLQPYAPENLAANQGISESKSRITNLRQQRNL